VREDQNPLRREGLLRRSAPFLAIALLAFAAVPLSSQPLNSPALVAAAALLALIVGAVVLVPWDRLPPYATSVPPIAYFLVVALLVQTAGGGPSGYVPLVLLPIFWLALYGTRSELAIAMVAAFSMFVAPLIFLHDRAYSQAELREALLWMAISLVVGFTAQGLVRKVREHAEETARRGQALVESEERQRLILETAGEAFVSMDAEGSISGWNASAEQTFGWKREEAIGRQLVETIIPPASREDHRQGLEHFLRTGKGPLLGKTIEQMALHRDGHEIPVELTISPLRVGDGYVFNSFIRDITERQEAQREADRLKDEFFALVSHELRTPLTSIIGYLELVKDDAEGKLDEEAWDHLEVMQRNADRLLRLVGDILLVAQVQAGTFTVATEQSDVSTLVLHAVEAATPIAEAKGVALDLHSDPVPSIEVDRDRLAQLLDNLISNALKFTPAGERINVRSSASDGAVVIEVENTGSYLSPEEQEQLFDRFFRTSDAVHNAMGGVGLGLAICKAIVEAHGGQISVRSKEDVATTFIVRLPVSDPRQPQSTTHEQAEALV
jgi:two-component system, OmpR family, phosphate regulon sensor histidine kinase PhoR